MKKKSRRVMETVCSGCIGTFKFKELNLVHVTMHENNPSSGYYGTYVCDKCEPKYRLSRRVLIDNE